MVAKDGHKRQPASSNKRKALDPTCGGLQEASRASKTAHVQGDTSVHSNIRDGSSWSEDLPAELCDMVIEILAEDVKHAVNPLLGLIDRDLFQPDLRNLRLVSRKWNARVMESRRFSRRTTFVRYTEPSLENFSKLSTSEFAHCVEKVVFAMPNVDYNGHCEVMREGGVMPSLKYYDEILSDALPRFLNLESIWIVGTSNAVRGEMILRNSARNRATNDPIYLSKKLPQAGWIHAQEGPGSIVNRLKVKSTPMRQDFVNFWVGKLYCGVDLPPSVHMVFDITGESRLSRPPLFREALNGLRECPGTNCFLCTYNKERKRWGIFHTRVWKKTSAFHGDVTVLNVFRAAEASTFSVKGSDDARFIIETFDQPTAHTPYVRLKKMHLSYIEVEGMELFNIGSCQAQGMLEEVHLDHLIIVSGYSNYGYSRFFDALAACTHLIDLHVSKLRYARGKYVNSVSHEIRFQDDVNALQRLAKQVCRNRVAKGLDLRAPIVDDEAFEREYDEADDDLVDGQWWASPDTA